MLWNYKLTQLHQRKPDVNYLPFQHSLSGFLQRPTSRRPASRRAWASHRCSTSRRRASPRSPARGCSSRKGRSPAPIKGPAKPYYHQWPTTNPGCHPRPSADPIALAAESGKHDPIWWWRGQRRGGRGGAPRGVDLGAGGSGQIMRPAAPLERAAEREGTGEDEGGGWGRLPWQEADESGAGRRGKEGARTEDGGRDSRRTGKTSE